MSKKSKKEVKKRAESKLIPKQESRKRPEPEPEPELKKVKPQLDFKLVRLAMDAPQEEFKAMGERVQSGEVKWHHYAVDGNKGYHYYIVLSKSK